MSSTPQPKGDSGAARDFRFAFGSFGIIIVALIVITLLA